MTVDDLQELFEKHDDEYGEFDRVSPKRSGRHDLHAFLLLDELLPGTDRIVSAAEHDEIFLSVDLEDLAKSSITEAQVIELIRCRVRMSSFDSLCMFV